MMKKISIQTITILLLVLSNVFFILHPFQEKETEIEQTEIFDSITPHIQQHEIDFFAKQAINQGDNASYKKLSYSLIMNMQFYRLYYYSFIMANKYNSPDAYFDLYIILTRKITVNGINMYSSDEITQNYAKFYLLKSYELGIDRAKNYFDNIFINEDIHNSSYYLKKIAGDTASVPNN